MRVAFFASDKPREQLLGQAFIRGVEANGDTGDVRPRIEGKQVASDCDAVGFFGVKSSKLFNAHRAANINTLMFDKGYIRMGMRDSIKKGYIRVAVNGHHPNLKAKRYPDDRLKRLGLKPAAWRKAGRHIVILGSSAKYHKFYGLPNPTDYAQAVVHELRKYTDRPIIYRPKPSWRAAQPIVGADYSRSREPLANVLSGAWAVVTHGSNACFEAILAGVPCIVLGKAIARPISSIRLCDIEAPLLADQRARWQWFSNLAYHQWTFSEFNSGQAWEVIRCEISPA